MGGGIGLFALVTAAVVAVLIIQWQRGEIDGVRLGKLAAVGGFAGIVIFFVFNPELARQEAMLPQFDLDSRFDIDKLMESVKDLQEIASTPDPRMAFMFTGFFAAMVGGLLTIADRVQLFTREIVKRALAKALLAAISGLIVGGAAGVLIDLACTSLCRISVFFLALFQPLGWLLMGMWSGLALGITLGSRRRLFACMLGGIVGGFIGGTAFEVIGGISSLVFQTGTLGRAFGFPIMGAGIGAALAWAEDVAKKRWITVLNGAKEGRQYILSKPTTTIGRDELADIPLFGDTSVAKRHADLILNPYVVMLQSIGGEVEINGALEQSKQLMPLDTIRIGRHLLRFHQKGEARRLMPVAQQKVFHGPAAAPPPAAPQAGYVPAQTMVQPVTATGSLGLVACSGPHTGLRLQFQPGTVRIGRELDHEVLLALDTLVSRTHAEIAWTGTSWVVRDLGSRHGLWVNGVRVSEHVLNAGDQVGVGQSWLTVEGV